MVLEISLKQRPFGRKSVAKLKDINKSIKERANKILETAGINASKAVEKYIAEEFVKYALKDPNIASAMNNNEQIRGALGLWKSTDIKKSIVKSLSRNLWKNRKAAEGKERKKFEIGFIKQNFNTAIKSLYYISKRSPKKTRGGKRGVGINEKKIDWFDWLVNPSHGKVMGYSVWPGLGKSAEIQSSRSGTHTMVNGGSFAIKNWLPRKTDIGDRLVNEFVKKIKGNADSLFNELLSKQLGKKAKKEKERIREKSFENIEQFAESDNYDSGTRSEANDRQNQQIEIISNILKKGGRDQLAIYALSNGLSEKDVPALVNMIMNYRNLTGGK